MSFFRAVIYLSLIHILEVMDAEEKRLAMLYFRWDEVASLLRGMYARQQDGFGQEPVSYTHLISLNGVLQLRKMQPQKNRQSKTVTRKKWRLKDF